ncbi:hypothetical protein B0T22DRAFT_518860 [Podospora appendiculata]|uniref:Uncharacterized protein n=1 Tax=Podospora appendiculata TaxID=314037 RepID=A0AAE1CB36_9PEZI|nr:hypothetical protein B0T22DRAFT_518860 [Podospora appendiculata]
MPNLRVTLLFLSRYMFGTQVDFEYQPSALLMTADEAYNVLRDLFRDLIPQGVVQFCDQALDSSRPRYVIISPVDESLDKEVRWRFTHWELGRFSVVQSIKADDRAMKQATGSENTERIVRFSLQDTVKDAGVAVELIKAISNRDPAESLNALSKVGSTKFGQDLVKTYGPAAQTEREKKKAELAERFTDLQERLQNTNKLFAHVGNVIAHGQGSYQKTSAAVLKDVQSMHEADKSLSITRAASTAILTSICGCAHMLGYSPISPDALPVIIPLVCIPASYITWECLNMRNSSQKAQHATQLDITSRQLNTAFEQYHLAIARAFASQVLKIEISEMDSVAQMNTVLECLGVDSTSLGDMKYVDAFSEYRLERFLSVYGPFKNQLKAVVDENQFIHDDRIFSGKEKGGRRDDMD